MLFVKKNKLFTKVFILLLLLIVSCGGSGEETTVEDTTTTTVEDTTTTTVQDTTTTTIPPAPTSDTNYIEIYNSKLGTELCSDAKEIDTTSEECLRQYKENLNYLITLQNEIGDFGSDLIAYYETYPELINQEYEEYINFVENEYSQVFTAANNVENKYIERFGGVPLLNSVSINSDLWNECPADIEIQGTENIKSGYLIYTNKIGEKIEIPLEGAQNYFTKKLNVMGGEFIFTSSKLINYLDEEFENIISPVDSIYVNHWGAYFTKVEILNYDNNQITVSVEWENGYLNMEAFSLLFQREGLYEGNMNVVGLTKYGSEKAKELNKRTFLEDLPSLTYIERSDNKTVVSYNFKQQQAIELTEEPFRLNRIMSTDAWYENRNDLVYFYRFNDARTNVVAIEFTRKVGCNGEGSVQNKNEYIELNDFNFTLPFNTYESYFVTKP